MSNNSETNPVQTSVDAYEAFYKRNKATIHRVAVVGVILYLNKRMVRRVVAAELLKIRFEVVPFGGPGATTADANAKAFYDGWYAALSSPSAVKEAVQTLS